MPFNVMSMLRNHVLKTKKILKGFHDAPTGPAQAHQDHHRNHGDRRFAQYKDQLERAINYTNIALRGFAPASRITGRSELVEMIDHGVTVTTRIQNALYTIQNTIQASVLTTEGVLVGELSGGLCVHACDALTIAAAEIEACVKRAHEVSQTPVSQ